MDEAIRSVVSMIISAILTTSGGSSLSLSDLPIETQRSFVYRAMGEARGDGSEAVSGVVGTMLCRLESGYGTPLELLGAYRARDFMVDDSVVASFGESTCIGEKYALSAVLDIPNLNISEDVPRRCVGDTCFFYVWAAGTGGE